MKNRERGACKQKIGHCRMFIHFVIYAMAFSAEVLYDGNVTGHKTGGTSQKSFAIGNFIIAGTGRGQEPAEVFRLRERCRFMNMIYSDKEANIE